MMTCDTYNKLKLNEVIWIVGSDGMMLRVFLKSNKSWPKIFEEEREEWDLGLHFLWDPVNIKSSFIPSFE